MSASRASLVYASRRKPLAACAATLFGLSASAAVHAGTAFVTNCATSAATIGSLPWAATQAVNNGDIIDMTGITDFSACYPNKDGFAQTILLPSAVTVHTGVTIKGPNTSSSKALAVTTDLADRVFYSQGSITVKNLGIKYGKATTTNSSLGGNSVYGGCVYARLGLTLNGVVLDNCIAYTKAAGKDAKGGSVATYNGPIVLTNTTITNSNATSHTSGAAFGGAVYGTGDITLTNSSVSGSNATAKSGLSRGGGITMRSGSNLTVTLTNSEVSYSYALGYGGFNAAGGGIYSSGYVTLSGSGLSHTEAFQKDATNGRAAGGGIFANLHVSLTNSELDHCYAITESNDKGLGGGIYGGAGVTLSSSAIYLSETKSTNGNAYGGGIFSVGRTTAHYSNLIDNDAAINSAFSVGGAIFSNGGVEFNYGTVANSGAQESGGIAIEAGNLYLRGATLYNNQAQLNASAIGMQTGGGSSEATIINSTISGNTIGNSTVGKYAVYINAHSTKLYNSTIAYNTGGIKAGTYLTGAAGSTAGLYSTLMSSNSYSNGTQNDFSKNTNVTFTAASSHNLIRHPSSLVPNGTLSGASACPFLHKLADNGGPH
jgi:hypothetical protein